MLLNSSSGKENIMDSTEPTATIEVHKIVAGNEPLGETVTLSLGMDGSTIRPALAVRVTSWPL